MSAEPTQPETVSTRKGRLLRSTKQRRTTTVNRMVGLTAATVSDAAEAYQHGYIPGNKKWTKNEEIRLCCALMGSDDRVAPGISFLRYLREGKDRSNLDRSEFVVADAIARIFNDESQQWPEFETFAPCQRYPPTSAASIILPRNLAQ